MPELMVDLIISLDGYASAEGWPGWWGLESAEYLEWLGAQPESSFVTLMGARTYRLMSGFAAGTAGTELEHDAMKGLTEAPKIVVSSTLEEPLEWPSTRLVRGDAVEQVRRLKEEGDLPLHTLGSLSLCRSLLRAGLVDRYRLVIFPVITGATGSERIFDGYPDVALELVESRTFEGGLQLLDYVPRVLDGPPGSS
jgi:dihydrofolate reductase